MKLLKSKLRVLALAAGSLAITMAAANAQNANYAAGDLVLAFQEEGGMNTLYVNLGNTATVFRGAAAGVDVGNSLNIINISSQLNSAFGASWATNVNLYAGLSGVWGTGSALSSTLQNGDPNRTLYVSQARTAVGTVGTANSAGWSVSSDGGMTTGANGMTAQNNTLETTVGAGQTLVATTGNSTIDEANLFLAPDTQGTGFGIFNNGVQQVGSAASFGSLGPVNNVEFALDVYRILAKTGIAGQVGGTLRAGSYEGTVTVDNSGQVSFVTSAVPEPSTYALLGVSALVIGFVIRRRRAQNL